MSGQLPELLTQEVVNAATLLEQLAQVGAESSFSAQELAEMREVAKLMSKALAEYKW